MTQESHVHNFKNLFADFPKETQAFGCSSGFGYADHTEQLFGRLLIRYSKHKLLFLSMKSMTSKLTRSENMSRIRGKNTKPEIQLRKALWEKGFRFRINIDLPGRPDLVFLKSRLAIFVDGCFWHGCPLHYSAPATREEFWQKKLRDNVFRDIAVDDELISMNWKVLRIWQHELKDIETVIFKVSELTEIPLKIYSHTVSLSIKVAESVAEYGGTQSRLKCCCGSGDVCVIGISGPGSLRPNSRNKPDQIEIICRKCRNICSLKVGRQ